MSTPLELESVSAHDVTLMGLVRSFVETATVADASFRRLGRLRHQIEAHLMPGQKLFSVLREAGASHSAISNALYGRNAWQRVEDGEITEADFENLSFADCILLHRVQIVSQPLPDVLRVRRTYDLSDEVSVKLAALPDEEDLEVWAARAAKHHMQPLQLAASIARGEVVPVGELHQHRDAGSGMENLPGILARWSRWFGRVGGSAYVQSLTSAEATALARSFRALREFMIAVERRAAG